MRINVDPVDDSDEWTDDDLRDAAIASLAYAEQSMFDAVGVDDASRNSADGTVARN